LRLFFKSELILIFSILGDRPKAAEGAVYNPDEIDIDDDEEDEEEEENSEGEENTTEPPKNIPVEKKSIPAKVFGGLKRKNDSDSE
jgi:hypothetical protein